MFVYKMKGQEKNYQASIVFLKMFYSRVKAHTLQYGEEKSKDENKQYNRTRTRTNNGELVGWLVSFFFNRIQHGHLAQFHEVAIQEEDRKLETTEMGSIQCKSRE